MDDCSCLLQFVRIAIVRLPFPDSCWTRVPAWAFLRRRCSVLADNAAGAMAVFRLGALSGESV